MKKYILTIILAVLVLALGVSTVFFALQTASLTKSVAEAEEKSKLENAKMQEEMSELKALNDTVQEEMTALENENDDLELKISTLIEEKNQLIFDIIGDKYKVVYKGDALEEKNTTVLEYVWQSGYMFVYISNVSGVDTVSDIIFYDYTWRRYIVDTVLIPHQIAGEETMFDDDDNLNFHDIEAFFGEADEEPAFSTMTRSLQWSLGDGYSYFVTEKSMGIRVATSKLICPDGTIIDLYPTE